MKYYVTFMLTTLCFITSCKSVGTNPKCSLPDNPEALINLLANSNDNKSLARRSYDKLIRMKEKALPALVAYSDDKRRAASPYQGYYSINDYATVGYVCFDIIAQVVGFESSKHAAFCMAFPNDLKKWYEKRKDWNIEEIKIELLYCRIRCIEETSIDILWALDDKEKKQRLRHLHDTIKKNDKSKYKHHYAWQEPTRLSKLKAQKIAQVFLTERGYRWQDYTEANISYMYLLDSWSVIFYKEMFPKRFHYLGVTIDDTTSDIEFKEWDESY